MSLLAHGSELENSRAAASTAGGGSSAADSAAGSSEDGGAGEWCRIYDRIEALLPRVEALAGDRARLEEIAELSEAREKSLHARLLQVFPLICEFLLGFPFFGLLDFFFLDSEGEQLPGSISFLMTRTKN
jgi:hypothetical protein